MDYNLSQQGSPVDTVRGRPPAGWTEQDTAGLVTLLSWGVILRDLDDCLVRIGLAGNAEVKARRDALVDHVKTTIIQQFRTAP